MSKYKDFILQRKAVEFKKSVQEGKLPEQNTYVTLYNNSYKVLTKPDAKIAILEDNRSNKIAYSRDAFVKMMAESNEDKVAKAGEAYGTKPKTLVGSIGSNVKPKGAGASAGSAAPKVDPVGTVRNNRKKVVSKKTGQTMWVDIATGEGHAEHNTHTPQETSKEAQAQAKTFFDSLGDKIHPSDKVKLERQMNDIVSLKQKIQNVMDMTHQDDRQKLSDAQVSRKQVFALQDQYKKAFKEFETSLKESAGKAKKESGNDA